MSSTPAASLHRGTVVIEVQEKLSLRDSVSSLHSRLRSLAESGQLQVVLDLAAVATMDTADIGELAAACAAIILAGGEVKLLHPTEAVQRVPRLTRVASFLELYFDEASAIDSFTRVSPTGAEFYCG
jgi:anti-anti-sigma factor